MTTSSLLQMTCGPGLGSDLVSEQSQWVSLETLSCPDFLASWTKREKQKKQEEGWDVRGQRGSERRGRERRKKKENQKKRWRERKAGEMESGRRGSLDNFAIWPRWPVTLTSGFFPGASPCQSHNKPSLHPWVKQVAQWGPSEVAYPKQEILQMASLHSHLRDVKGPGKFPSSVLHLAQLICTVDETVARALPLWDLRLPICKWGWDWDRVWPTRLPLQLRHSRMTFIPGILLPPFLENHYRANLECLARNQFQPEGRVSKVRG